MRFITLVLCLLTSPCFAQVLTEQKVQTWTGFDNPVIVNGAIITGPNSKPVVKTTTQIVINSDVPFKYVLLTARHIETQVKTTLTPTNSIYSFRPDMPAGKYKIELIAFEPGIVQEEIEVDNTSVPPPGNDPVGPVLTGVPESARKIMSEYVASMAQDMQTVADEVKQNKHPNQTSTQKRGVALDTLTRVKFKENIGKLMNDAATEPPTADLFENIATGYEAVK